MLATLLATAPVANAQSYEEALAKFAANSYGDTDAAVTAVAASGNPLAAQVIEALQDGRLLFSAADKKVYIKKVPAGLVDAATGQAVAGAEPAGLSPVRVNNRVRRAIEAAIGNLTLLSPDPAKRYEAAKAVFKSKDASMLATLETAIGKEPDARVKKVLEEARAAIVVGKSDAKEADRLAAIALLRDRGDQDARSAIASVSGDQPANVQKAVADALVTIDNRLAVWGVAQNLWYGLSLGSVLLLAAIGLAHHLRRHGRDRDGTYRSLTIVARSSSRSTGAAQVRRSARGTRGRWCRGRHGCRSPRRCRRSRARRRDGGGPRPRSRRGRRSRRA